jgi:hypothetical protein
MSNPTSDPHAHDDPHGKQGEDHIDFVKVVGVGVVSLIIFALATWWAAIILRRETAKAYEQSGKSKPVEIGRTEIGIVDQVPFVSDHRLEDWRKERSEKLHGFGWTDRAKGLIHIPIEKAMDRVAAGAKPAGAPK